MKICYNRCRHFVQGNGVAGFMEKSEGRFPWAKTAARETVAGWVNAMTLLSGFVAIPSLLFQAGMDFTGAYVSCVLVSILGTLSAGFTTGQPWVLAPGVALSSWIVCVEILSRGERWQGILGAAFLAAILGSLLLLTPLRSIFMEAIPICLRRALMGGVGLLLVVQGLIQGRLLVGSPFDVMMLGNLMDPVAYLSLCGIFVTFVLMANGIALSLAWGTLVTAAVAWIQGFWEIPDAPFLLPEGLEKVALQMDVSEGLLLPEVIISFLLLLLMESAGTFQALRGECPEEGSPPRRLFFGILGAGALGSLLGSLPPRLAAESAAGIASGGCRGWTSYATAFFLGLMLFCEPLAKEMASFGAIAAPGMVGAGFWMLWRMGDAFYGDMADVAASWCLLLALPFSHDVGTGLGISLIAHVALKCFSGNPAAVSGGEMGMAAFFAAYFFCGLCP